jgi:hypothetical protein
MFRCRITQLNSRRGQTRVFASDVCYSLALLSALTVLLAKAALLPTCELQRFLWQYYEYTFFYNSPLWRCAVITETVDISHVCTIKWVVITQQPDQLSHHGFKISDNVDCLRHLKKYTRRFKRYCLGLFQVVMYRLAWLLIGRFRIPLHH